MFVLVKRLTATQRKSSKFKVDATDMQIIRSLQEDSRVSLRKLSQKTGVTSTMLRNRIATLEDQRIIRGYVPVLDGTKMGYAVTAVIMLQIEGGHLQEVEAEIARESNVVSVYDVTGEYDAIIFAKFRDNPSLNDFLKNLLTEKFIKRSSTVVALNAVKEHTKII